MPRRRARALVEWVGGRLSPPFFIEQGDEPYRAELALWLELPSGLVVGQKVFAPKDGEGAVGRVLRDALERPLAGPPRRPDTIRVCDRALAAEVRAAVGYARSIPSWQTAGYRIGLVFLALPSAEFAIARVAMRVRQGGHGVPDEVVRRRFTSGWENFERVFKVLADEWRLYDNSGPRPVLVERGGRE